MVGLRWGRRGAEKGPPAAALQTLPRGGRPMPREACGVRRLAGAVGRSRRGRRRSRGAGADLGVCRSTGFPNPQVSAFARSADWEIGATAGGETCLDAAGLVARRNGQVARSTRAGKGPPAAARQTLPRGGRPMPREACGVRRLAGAVGRSRRGRRCSRGVGPDLGAAGARVSQIRRPPRSPASPLGESASRPVGKPASAPGW